MTLPHSAKLKHAFLAKTKEKLKSQKKVPKKKFSLKLLHQRLGHIYTRSLLAGNTSNIWKDIEIRVDPDLFCTSCQISTINKKAISRKPLKLKTHFKLVFLDIIPATNTKSLRKETTFDNYLLIVDAYYNIQKNYGMENIITKEVINKIDMFQWISVKVD